jgi:hypothetical protein
VQLVWLAGLKVIHGNVKGRLSSEKEINGSFSGTRSCCGDLFWNTQEGEKDLDEQRTPGLLEVCFSNEICKNMRWWGTP